MGPPSPAFADEHWSSEGCNPFVISRLNLGKLLSCARVQHETQLKRHSNLSKPPVTHRTAAQGRASAAMPRVCRGRPRPVGIRSQANALRARRSVEPSVHRSWADITKDQADHL